MRISGDLHQRAQAGEYRTGKRTSSGEDDDNCRTLWRGQIFADQSSPAGCADGDREHQQKDREGKAYDAAFGTDPC